MNKRKKHEILKEMSDKMISRSLEKETRFNKIRKWRLSKIISILSKYSPKKCFFASQNSVVEM